MMNKLNLKAETVMQLQNRDLENIHGGTLTPASPPVFMASVRFCAAVSAAALGSAQRSCLTCRCR